RGMRAFFACEFERRAQYPVIDLFGNARRQFARGSAVERQAQREEKILQAHQAKTDRTPTQVRRTRRVDWIEIQIDHAIKLANRNLHRVRELGEIESVAIMVLG